VILKFQFVLGRSFSSRAIAWFSAGHFSHVDLVLPDGRLLGARSDVILNIPPGVQIRPPNYEEWKERVVLSLEVTELQLQSVIAFNMSQLGEPYDKTAIWGFVAGRDWREEDSWFCSELQAAAIESANIWPALYTPRNKVTPAALATVLSAVGAQWSEAQPKEPTQ
jgi:hypothetical protein